MKNHDSDVISKLDFPKYYRLTNVPETMSLIEAECFDTPVDTAESDSQPLTKEIVFALGMTITLIVLSFFQLYSSVGTTPGNSKTISPRKLSIYNTKVDILSKRKLNSLPSYQKIDSSTDKIQILMLKNEIANGKF